MTALWSSFVIVALAEMGDKTQLIAFSLATRYRRPWTVMLGILLATLLNHALAATVGVWLSRLIPPPALAVILALTFIGFGLWTLMPDTAEEPGQRPGWGPLASTCVIFFLAEMGDKTQLATVALGARFASTMMVTAGTTLGMLAADGLAVFAAFKLDRVVPLRYVRVVAAVLFFAFGLAALAGAAGLF
jgi:putative Ca2+/H+ antiporter (TMEM165/GDT1 family)